MELGTREILLAVGLLLIVVIVWDGIRRIRQSGHGQIRMARRQRVFDEDDDSYDPYGGELSSEVRVRERDARETPVVRPRGTARSQPVFDDEDDPLLQPAARTRGRREAPSRPVRREPAWSQPQEDPADAAMQPSPPPVEAEDWHEAPSFEDEEQHELMLDMPQQEALNLSEDMEPPEAVTGVRRRRDRATAAADEFEQDIRHTTAQHGVRPDVDIGLEASPTEPAAEKAPAAKRQPRDDGPMPEVIALHVMASRNGHFRGEDLLDEFMANDLRYGSMKIFHRHQDQDGVGPVLFSLANSVKPGTFDLNAMDAFSTPGISLFMALDDLDNPTDAFEQLLEVAHNLAAGLGGELKDESRSALTRQTEDHCRQRIKEFERRRLYRPTHL